MNSRADSFISYTALKPFDRKMTDSPPDDLQLSTRLERWKMYAEISDTSTITRRVFTMNGFDGALTILGVSIGAYMSHIDDPSVLIMAGISGAFAMGISGFCGAYMAESAERAKEIKDMERALLKPLDEDSTHMEAAKFATNITAIVTALSPVTTGLIVLSPYFLANSGSISMDTAFIVSLLLAFAVLTGMGVYLAKVTHGNMLTHGLKMLAIGIAVAVLCSGVSILLGA
jgi:predicted membrane protein (TIGR00267 family)